MNFAAIAVGAGVAGALFVAYLQGPPAPKISQIDNATVLDATQTGSITPATTTRSSSLGGETAQPSVQAVRLIDLRNGATCKIGSSAKVGPTFEPVPIGPDCASSPELSRVAQWRGGRDGSLEMADRNGNTVLKFAPGDGVLYESIYPSEAMVTIVPARG